MATRDPGYTRTGNSFLTDWANKISFVPGMGFISAPLIFLDTILGAAGQLLRGKPLSALAVAGSGAAAGFTAGMNSFGNPALPIWWGINVVSGITTGRSIQTHVRKGTETVASVATKPLGVQPTVLRSYPAGIGAAPGAMPTQPGRFASAESGRRGQNAQEAHDAYMRGEGGVHVNQLASANGRG